MVRLLIINFFIFFSTAAAAASIECDRLEERARPLNGTALTNIKDANKVAAITLTPAEISITACTLTPYPNPSIILTYVLNKAIVGSSFLLNVRGELANSLYPDSPKKVSRLLFNKEITVTKQQSINETIKLDQNHELFKSWRKCDLRPPVECLATRVNDETNVNSDCYKKFWGNEEASTKNCPLEIKGSKLSAVLEHLPDASGVKYPIKTVHTSITKPEKNFISINCGGSGFSTGSNVAIPSSKPTITKKEEVKEVEQSEIQTPQNNIPTLPSTIQPPSLSNIKEILNAQPLPPNNFAPSMIIEVSPGAR
ncbi:MAG: hypothetical protein U0T83_09375 [Bacteriovoracaceae bacterium]